MATQPDQTAEEQYNPMLEALIRELIGVSSHSKTSQKAVTAVLTEELMTSLIPSTRATSQTTSLEIAILAEALAPALAEALAPALAEALTPALIKALDTLVSQKKSAEEARSKEASRKQEEASRKQEEAFNKQEEAFNKQEETSNKQEETSNKQEEA